MFSTKPNTFCCSAGSLDELIRSHP